MNTVRITDLTKLSEAQIEVVIAMHEHRTGSLKQHMNGSKKVYRLMDENSNPILNLDYIVVRKLWDVGLIKMDLYNGKETFELQYGNWLIDQVVNICK
jgi:hypothetical protein